MKQTQKKPTQTQKEEKQMFSFDDIKLMYDWNCFTNDQVKEFVPMCITKEQYKEITGEAF